MATELKVALKRCPGLSSKTYSFSTLNEVSLSSNVPAPRIKYSNTQLILLNLLLLEKRLREIPHIFSKTGDKQIWKIQCFWVFLMVAFLLTLECILHLTSTFTFLDPFPHGIRWRVILWKFVMWNVCLGTNNIAFHQA